MEGLIFFVGMMALAPAGYVGPRRKSVAELRAEYEQARIDNAPWIEAGHRALEALARVD